MKKKTAKPYWEMTTAELRQATKQFDEEFVADQSRPLTAEERAIWEAVRRQPAHPDNGKPIQTISVRLEKTLLEQCAALARRKRLTRDALIARGLRALLAAEGK